MVIACCIETLALKENVAGLQAWESLADGAMKNRAKENSRLPYQGDEYRLYATAKVLSFSIASMLGSAPRQAGETESTTQKKHESVSENGLKNLVTCLVACLDCHCDLGARCSKPIMACLCAYITTAYSRACQQLLTSRSNQEVAVFVPPIKALGVASASITSRTFKRCFSVMTSESTIGLESEICFRSLLSAVRGAALLTGLVRGEVEPNRGIRAGAQTGSDEAEDDLWGGIEDDAFASINLDEMEGCDPQEETTLPVEKLIPFLSSALFVSKVSKYLATLCSASLLPYTNHLPAFK